MPDDGETVSTPVTDVTETETGTVVVGYPPNTGTGSSEAPTEGADNSFDPQSPEQQGA